MKKKKDKKPSKRNGSIARYSFVLRYARYQLPTFVAILVIAILSQSQFYGPNAYSLVAIVLLTGVIYTAFHRGVLQGAISAVITVAYNTALLVGTVEYISLGDRNMRRIALLAIVLPVLAVIVGRLKDRNDYLLSLETRARVQAEESEKRLRFMAESMPQKVFTTTPKGAGDYFNPQWVVYTGLSIRQLERKDWRRLIHSDDIEETLSRWEHSVKTGEPYEMEYRLRRHDGAYRWHVCRAHAMHDKNGNIIKWVGSNTDIHDIKLALQREHQLENKAATLAEQREQLMALNTVKDEFISISSHQLRTPATGVKQYMGMVLEGYAGKITPEQRAFLQQAYESNERQLTIINNLLKVAQVDAGKVSLKKEKTNLVELTKQILNEQASKFTKREQKVIFQPQQKTVIGMVDKNNLRMVLENIIDNANKYTPPGKTIKVMVRKSKATILITVKDEGVGIAPNDIDKIFQKFSRIDNPLSVLMGGSGLGLYWAKKIIDLHKGSLEVTSELNKGSTFTVKLPGK